MVGGANNEDENHIPPGLSYDFPGLWSCSPGILKHLAFVAKNAKVLDQKSLYMNRARNTKHVVGTLRIRT